MIVSVYYCLLLYKNYVYITVMLKLIKMHGNIINLKIY